MKILFHIPFPVVGGAETHIKYLIQNFPPHVTPLVTYEYVEVEEFVKTLGAQYFRVFSPAMLARQINAIAPDVFQFYHSHSAYSALKKLRQPPKVVEIVHNRLGFPGDATSYPKDCTDVAVGVSDDAADLFRSRCLNTRTVVIPNGVDTSIFNPYVKGSLGLKFHARRRPLGGFTGRLEGGEGKGIGRILNAVKDLDCDFELVGKDYGGWQDYAQKAGIKNVRFLPYTDNPLDAYVRWDFFVSGSPAEGFGLSIAEAISCGLPCAVWDCGGVVRYLKDGEHCLIRDTEEGFKNAIKKLIANDVALHPQRADLSAKTMTGLYVSLYNDLLGNSSSELTTQNKQIAQRLPDSEICASTTPDDNPKKIVNPVEGVLLGVCPEDWLGVKRSLMGYCTDYSSPANAIAKMRQLRPQIVVFGCYNFQWEDVLLEARRLGAKTVLTWHASYILNEFDHVNREWMWHGLDCARRRLFDFVATPHDGLAQTWSHYGIPTDFMPNIITTNLEPQTKLPGLNIGVLGSAQPWKNMDAQLVAAGMVPNAKVHVQRLAHTQSIDVLGLSVQAHGTLASDEDYYKLVGGMTVNMVVSVSETYSYFAAESMLLGTPIITTPITPVLKSAEPILQKCVTPHFEDPVEIKKTLVAVLDDYAGIKKAGRDHMVKLNEVNKRIVFDVCKKWLS